MTNIPEYLLELHDSQIQHVSQSEETLEILFSTAWLHPADRLYQPDYEPLEIKRRVRLVFANATVEGDWPDFEDDSYLSDGHYSASDPTYRDIPVPADISESLRVDFLFILGEEVTVQATGLTVEILSA